MLYTYRVKGEEPSYPGPVLMVEPGDNLKLNFENNIRIGDLSDEQNQQASLISNSTYGGSAGDGGNHEQLYLPQVLSNYSQLKCSAYRNNEYYGWGFVKIKSATEAEWIWQPNPEGSERIPLVMKHNISSAQLSRMNQGYVDSVVVGNYALLDDEEMNNKFTTNVHSL